MHSGAMPAGKKCKLDSTATGRNAHNVGTTTSSTSSDHSKIHGDCDVNTSNCNTYDYGDVEMADDVLVTNDTVLSGNDRANSTMIVLKHGNPAVQATTGFYHDNLVGDDTSTQSNNCQRTQMHTAEQPLSDQVLFARDLAAKTSNKDECSNSSIDEPYYLSNFNLAINTVLSDKDDRQLFNKEDNEVVRLFQDLACGAQKLYVRLYQRKFKWFQISKIKYPMIGEKLNQYFQELVDHGFLQTEDTLHDLEEILHLLPASEVQEVAKSMHIIGKNGSKSKKNLTQLLMNHGKRQRSLFANNGDSITKTIVKKCKELLGACVKLYGYPQDVFSRLILLFSLNMLADDDSCSGASQLSGLFLVNFGKVIYPSYDVCKETPLFCCRDELIKYREACEDLWKMEDLMENKKFDEARHVYDKVKVQFMEALRDLANDEPRLVYSVNLPVHLRRFTCIQVYSRACSRGVELLQRGKKYPEAVEQLTHLLSQDKFCMNHRGWWWERLSLNLHQHLQKPAEALDAIMNGLNDVMVRTGHRLALETRAKNITKKNASLRPRLEQISFTSLKQPEVVTISGRRLSDEPMFVLHEVNCDGSVDENITSYCGVEELAIRHYRRLGYNQGLHGEGVTFITLFALLMWHVIFAPGIQDVFRTPFQVAPLDIYCDNFYENRKKMIGERLDEIRNASTEELSDWIVSAWTEHHGKTCVGITWGLFSGVEQIKELCCCLGGRVLAGICERFARDYRNTRSGFPDLVVWSSTSLQFKIVEVKGPNDKLSTKQQIWLDVLVNLGIDAVVLYVKAHGGGRN